METTVKRKRRTAISRGITRICSHNIEWRLQGKGLDLSAIDVDSITNALIENNLEGNLCTISPNGEIVGGWWNIQWKASNRGGDSPRPIKLK